MSQKRPIDRRRESGVMMEVGSSEEGAIKEMVPIGKVMYIVKERAIYAIRLADQIDPDRYNMNIPNTQQKFASEGSESDRVSRILLTGRALFNKSYLAPDYDCDTGLSLCLRLLQDVLAMNDAATSLREAQDEAIKSMKESKGSLLLCSIPNVQSRAKGFIQRAEHAAQTLYTLCGSFFENDLNRKGRWFDGVAELIAENYGEADDFSVFAQRAARFCKFLGNARHCVEHEKSDQQIIVRDYALLPSGEVMPPTIEVVHRETPEPIVPLHNFMEQMTDSVVNVAETLMAFLCAKHVRPFSGLPVQVGLIPEEQRANKKVRYGYVVWMGDQLVRAS